jgi:hypothetical protein
MRTLILALCLATLSCVHAPPNLSPAGSAAFYGTRVVHGLDLLRDSAIAANEQTPTLVSTATTRTIVTFHQSAVRVIQATPSGWKPSVLTGLDETMATIPLDERKRLAPYVALVKTLIAEVR